MQNGCEWCGPDLFCMHLYLSYKVASWASQQLSCEGIFVLGCTQPLIAVLIALPDI